MNELDPRKTYLVIRGSHQDECPRRMDGWERNGGKKTTGVAEGQMTLKVGRQTMA